MFRLVMFEYCISWVLFLDDPVFCFFHLIPLLLDYLFIWFVIRGWSQDPFFVS